MNLREILDSVSEEAEVEAPEVASIEKIAEETSPVVAAPNEDIEKIASTLEALAEEDTLVDEIAKLAVLADFNEANLEKNALNIRVPFAGAGRRMGAKMDLNAALRRDAAEELFREADEVRELTSLRRQIRIAKEKARLGDPSDLEALRSLPRYSEASGDGTDEMTKKVLVGAGLLGAGALAGHLSTKSAKQQDLKETAEAYYAAGLSDAAKGMV